MNSHLFDQATEYQDLTVHLPRPYLLGDKFNGETEKYSIEGGAEKGRKGRHGPEPIRIRFQMC